MPGSMNVGQWATWLTHKQPKYMKSRHPVEPWMHRAMANKEWTLPIMFNIPTPQGGTRIAETKSLWPNLPNPNQNWTSQSCASIPFILPPIYMSSMTVTSWNYVTIVCCFIWGRKIPCKCTVESHQLACTTTDVPNPSPHEPLYKFCIPISMPVTLSPRYFGVPLCHSL